MGSKKVFERHAVEIDGFEIKDKHAIVDQFGKYFSETGEPIQQVGRIHKDQFQKQKFCDNKG